MRQKYILQTKEKSQSTNNRMEIYIWICGDNFSFAFKFFLSPKDVKWFNIFQWIEYFMVWIRSYVYQTIELSLFQLRKYQFITPRFEFWSQEKGTLRCEVCQCTYRTGFEFLRKLLVFSSLKSLWMFIVLIELYLLLWRAQWVVENSKL